MAMSTSVRLIFGLSSRFYSYIQQGRAESRMSLENNQSPREARKKFLCSLVENICSPLEMFSSNIQCSLVELKYCVTYQTAQLITLDHCIYIA